MSARMIAGIYALGPAVYFCVDDGPTYLHQAMRQLLPGWVRSQRASHASIWWTPLGGRTVQVAYMSCAGVSQQRLATARPVDLNDAAV